MRLVTLNLGHARGTAPSHWPLTRAAHLRALDAAAAVLRHHAPDLVALQEVDAPCLASGRLDHVGRLARATGLWGQGSVHHRSRLSATGTGLLAADEPRAVHDLPFAARGLTPRKGATLATVALDGRPVTIASVHLDFASGRTRRRQLLELREALSGPCVVAGDFNVPPDHPVMDALGLSTTDPGLTFPRTGASLDRVLVSAELELVRHEALDVHVSDHRPVIAELRWR